MKIGVISDTHDNVKNLLLATRYLNAQKVDLIYHCGDWISPFIFEFFYGVCKPSAPVKGVLGNNEGDRYRLLQRIAENNFPLTLEPYTLTDEIGGRKIILYHGQDPKITKSLLQAGQYDVVFTGHTHQPLIETVNKTLHVNPGTVCDAAKSRIIDAPTLAIYDASSNKAKITKFF